LTLPIIDGLEVVSLVAGHLLELPLMRATTVGFMASSEG
jgi:hypothetical protein